MTPAELQRRPCGSMQPQFARFAVESLPCWKLGAAGESGSPVDRRLGRQQAWRHRHGGPYCHGQAGEGLAMASEGVTAIAD